MWQDVARRWEHNWRGFAGEREQRQQLRNKIDWREMHAASDGGGGRA